LSDELILRDFRLFAGSRYLLFDLSVGPSDVSETFVISGRGYSLLCGVPGSIVNGWTRILFFLKKIVV